MVACLHGLTVLWGAVWSSSTRSCGQHGGEGGMEGRRGECTVSCNLSSMARHGTTHSTQHTHARAHTHTHTTPHPLILAQSLINDIGKFTCNFGSTGEVACSVPRRVLPQVRWLCHQHDAANLVIIKLFVTVTAGQRGMR